MNEDEKKDFLESARSAELRRDFEVMRNNSRPSDPKNLDLDAYLQFLEDFGQIFSRTGHSEKMTGDRFLI